jgi:hypothetical protein
LGVIVLGKVEESVNDALRNEEIRKGFPSLISLVGVFDWLVGGKFTRSGARSVRMKGAVKRGVMKSVYEVLFAISISISKRGGGATDERPAFRPRHSG